MPLFTNDIPVNTGTTWGDVLFFDGTKWVRLAAGTSGLFLQTLGAVADPVWASAAAVTATAPVNVTKAAAAVGTATDAARADHKHDVTTAAPSTGVGGANSEGTATTLARSDHNHALRTTDGPTDLAIGAITDGQVLVRVGSTIVGTTVAAGGVAATVAELNAGTDNAKFASSLGLEGSKYLDQDGSKLYAVATGTNTYAITITPAPTAYAAGNAYVVKFTNGNTTAATLNVNGLGATSIVKGAATALVSGDIPAGRICVLIYDGTNFLLDFYDTTAIHSNVASEISAITSKATPVIGDFLLIEDSAAANVKKRITIGSIPQGSGITREVFFPPVSNASSQTGDHNGVSQGANASLSMEFSVPVDFVALVSVVVVCIPAVTNATANIDLTSDFALPTQTFNTNSQSDTTATYALTANLITEINVGAVFSGLVANQQCGVAVKNNTIGGTNLILGIHLKYTT